MDNIKDDRYYIHVVRADIVYETIRNDLMPFRNALENYL